MDGYSVEADRDHTTAADSLGEGTNAMAACNINAACQGFNLAASSNFTSGSYKNATAPTVYKFGSCL